MTTINKILAGVLIAQGALAALTWWPSADVSHEAHALVQLDPATVTRLSVTGRNEGEAPEPVVLEKQGEHWLVASANGYPADPDKVSEVLDNLADIQVRAPIATQAASHASLEVADGRFTRKVEVAAGSGTHTLYMGAGSGSQVNVRLGDSADVYTARGFTAWSIGDNAKRYLDTQLVDVDKATVDSLTIKNAKGAFTVVKGEDGSWSSDALAAGQAVSDSDVEGLLSALLRVRLSDPVGKEVQPAYGLDGSQRVEWTVTVDGASTPGGYTIGAEADGKRYVKADDNDFVVQVFTSTLSKAVETSLDDITVADLDAALAPE